MKITATPQKVLIISSVFLFLLVIGSMLMFVNRENVSFDDRTSAFSPSERSIFLPIEHPDKNIVNQDGDSVEFPSKNLAWIGNGKSKSKSYLGLQFSAAGIDPKKDIDDVFLELTASDQKTDRSDLSRLNIEIEAEKGSESATFSKSNPPSKRPDFDKEQDYKTNSKWKDGKKYYISATNVVKEVLDEEDSPKMITLLIQGKGSTRDRRYFYTASGKAPRLVVNYKKDKSAPTPTTTIKPTATTAPTVTKTPTPSVKPTSTTPTPTIAPTATTPPSGTIVPGAKQVSPGQDLKSAIESVNPGETLYVRGGTYTGDFTVTPKAGTASARVTIKAYPGERPVISGLLRVSKPQYVTFDGINVTWNTSIGTKGDHMVKFDGGASWVYQNSEIWGAKSYAGLLITGNGRDWNVNHMYFHDTYPSNDSNQDHLIYVPSGINGVIERNLFVNSLNGRGIKLGPAGGSDVPDGITIRYNTFYNNTGPSNVQMSYGAKNNKIYRNIMVKSSAQNVTEGSSCGAGNLVYENIGWESSAVVELTSNIKEVAGTNLHIDPKLDGSYNPTNTQALGYGRNAK